MCKYMGIIGRFDGVFRTVWASNLIPPALFIFCTFKREACMVAWKP